MSTAHRRQDGLLLAAGLAAAVLFFLSLGELWPLARTRLVSWDGLTAEARSFLEGQGHDLRGFAAGERLAVDGDAIDYIEERFGREQAQSWIADGFPLVYRHVTFKKRGDNVTYSVTVHPTGRVLGWAERIDEDQAGARLEVEAARSLATAAIEHGLAIDPGELEERAASTTDLPARRSHAFRFERLLSREPELAERIRVVIDGDRVSAASRRLEVPDAAEREQVAAAAPGAAVEMVGFLVLGTFAGIAFWVFLVRLRDGSVDLASAAFWPSLVFVCLMATWALETPALFEHWEPLWPKWISDLRYLGARAIEQSWIALVLLAVVAAGDVLDRDLGGERGAALRELARGKFLGQTVARASARGFLVGLICGGVMAAAVLGLEWLFGARTSIQPRGFFFYTLNTASPVATSVLFFFGVALAEELGYRFYAGSLILARTGRRWLAILAPAVVYGLTHTNLDFLPPTEPWWGRPVVLTLVGCVWGWAFFRYGALTVVLSHFTADLFIFNWPQLASGEPRTVVAAAATIALPLAPALLRPLVGLARRGRARST